ncbi:MAG: SDR family oxidoreductase [Hymenobacter sp.]
MQGGAVVAVSSVHAFQSTPNVAPYAISKSGLEAFVRGLSLEVPYTQARINAVAPGASRNAHAAQQPQRGERHRSHYGPGRYARRAGRRHLLPGLG